MADYTDSKNGPGDVFLDGATDMNYSRSEPLITPTQVVRKHLFGLPLYSGVKDPVTGIADKLTTDDIAEQIIDAVATAELETGLTLFPTAVDERQAFDIHLYNSFGYMMLRKRPCASIESLRVTPSNDIDIFEVPLEWISTAYLHQGQLNIVPLTTSLISGAAMASQPTTTANGAAFMAIFGSQRRWIPAFWRVKYTAGFPEGKIPRVVNQLIGTIAAMEILTQLAATYGRTGGQSLSIDGMSQSTSTPGPEIFTKRVKDLETKRAVLTKKLKAMYGMTLFSGNV